MVSSNKQKINMPLVSQISYLAMYMLAKKGSKREDSLKKCGVFFRCQLAIAKELILCFLKIIK